MDEGKATARTKRNTWRASASSRKNLTGKEKLTYMVDEVFLAYNSARLKEACQLFAEPDARARM